MSDKFSDEYAPVQGLNPPCTTCKYRSNVTAGRCVAFPDGIPTEILVGENDHTKPVAGDHGIRYEPIE